MFCLAKLTILGLTLLCAGGIRVQAAGEYRLIYERSTHKVPLEYGEQKQLKGEAPKEEKKTLTQTFGLGSDYVYLQSEKKRTEYDFKTRLIYDIDHAKKEYSRYSLHSKIGHLSAEFQNRQLLRKAMAAGGMTEEENPFNLFMLEMTFGLRSGQEEELTRIEIKETGTSTQYLHGGKVIAECWFSKTEIPVESCKGYRRFLVNCLELHPDIREDIERRGLVPSALYYECLILPYKVSVRMELKQAGEVVAGSGVSKGYRQDYGGGKERLAAVITAVKTDKSKPPTKQELIRASEKYYAAGNDLDALLALLEYNLMIGKQDPEIIGAMKKMSAKGNYSEETLFFLKGMSRQGSKEECKTAVGILKGVKHTRPEYGHIVDIMLANALMKLGEGNPEELFLGVLKRNPYIVGVYKDLGDYYYRSYLMKYAWICWDFARELQPDHANLTPIIQLEKHLLATHPEFF